MPLVFDFDGVIVDTRTDNIAAINVLAPKYGFAPMDVQSYSTMCACNFYEYWQMLLGAHAESFFMDLHVMPRPKAELLPGMQSILVQHKPKIVSSNFTKLIQDTLAQYNIALDVYGGDVDTSKVRKLVKLHGEPAVFVTDTVGDILEGKQAGYVTIGVTWGFTDHAVLRAAQPTLLATSPQELEQQIVIAQARSLLRV